MCHGVTIERSRFNCAIGRRKVRQIFVRRSRHEKFKNAIFYSQDLSLYMYKIFERKFGWKIYKEPGYAIGLHIPSYHNHVTDTDPWNKQHTRHSSNLLRFRSFPTSSVSCRPLFPRLLHTASQLPVPRHHQAAPGRPTTATSLSMLPNCAQNAPLFFHPEGRSVARSMLKTHLSQPHQR